MPTPIGSVGPTQVTDAIGQQVTSSVARTDTQGALGQDSFLKLLVAQLKYQDPSSPVDSAQFMSQTAQFQQVQTLSSVADLTTQMVAAQRLLNGSALIGRQVTYTGADGKDVTGAVTSASFSPADGATVHVGTGATAKDVAVTAITKIAETTAG